MLLLSFICQIYASKNVIVIYLSCKLRFRKRKIILFNMLYCKTLNDRDVTSSNVMLKFNRLLSQTETMTQHIRVIHAVHYDRHDCVHFSQIDLDYHILV
jgi:hypothetical protein